MFWIGMFIGAFVGIVAIGLVNMAHSDDEMCSDCRTHSQAIIRDLESQIAGLKSSKGKLGAALQRKWS